MLFLLVFFFFFLIVLLCILATSNLSCLCLVFTILSLLCPFWMTCFSFILVSLIFLRRSLDFSILLLSSYLSLLFPGTLYSVGCIFPFLYCFFTSILSYLWSLLRQSLCLHEFLFLGDGLRTASCMLQTSVHSALGTLSTRSDPLNLFITSTI